MILRTAVQPGLVGRAEADRGGLRDHLGRRSGERVERAGALGGDWAASRPDARADERPLQRGRVELGPRLCERGRGAAGQRGRRARAADRRVAGGAVGVPARVGRDELDAGRRHLRLDPAAEGEPLRGERRDRRRGARSSAVRARRARRARRSRGRARSGAQPRPQLGMPITGTSRRSSRPSAPAGTTPSTRIAAAPASTAERASSIGPDCAREQRRAAGDEAVALVVEVAGERRSARAGRRVPPRSRDCQRERPARRRGAGERDLAVEQHVQARPHDHANRRRVVAQVRRCDRQRVRRSAGAADAPVARARRPLVARRGRRRACRAARRPRSRGRSDRPGRMRTARSRRRPRPERRRARRRRRRDRRHARSRRAADRCGRRRRSRPRRSAAIRRRGSAGSGTPGRRRESRPGRRCPRSARPAACRAARAASARRGAHARSRAARDRACRARRAAGRG